MKTFLICPAERAEVSAFADFNPLVNLSILGKPILHHWLDHLAGLGVKEVKILAADRPEQIRESVGNGSRWGLCIETIPQSHELTCLEAQEKFSGSNISDEFQLGDFILVDHLPTVPEIKLFSGYADFFAALQNWISQDTVRTIGVKEIQPGIWVNLRSRISPHAKLHAPCWIGENAIIESDVEIGPMAILEDGVVVEKGATVQQSWIAQKTFVGTLTQIKDSFALGNTLINFRNNSVVEITDPFLLGALQGRPNSARSGNILGRIAAFFALILTAPFALITFCKAKWAGHRALRPRRAVSPHASGEHRPLVVYYEFTNANGFWKRWPQLWNIVRGDFTWIGNRPLTSIEAGKLSNDFERLWLECPIGLISQGEAAGCLDLHSDEARAHASFYAVQANWRLDFLVFFRATERLLGRKLVAPKPVAESGAEKATQIPFAARFR